MGLELTIEQWKSDLKALVKLQLRGQIDEGVYCEENVRISKELDEMRKKKTDLEKANHQVYRCKERVEEIVQIVNSWQGVLEQFNDEMFNALVEKIDILSPEHFCFVLKSGLHVDEKFLWMYIFWLSCL